MSKTHCENLRCPQCGQETRQNLWDSLNADLEPAAKEELMAGRLLRFQCPHCGAETPLACSLLYHDMSRRFMVYLVAEGALEEAERTMRSLPLPDYRLRLVTDENALREKIILFDNGLDDRVMEILKLVYLMDVMQQRPEAGIQEIFFCIVDGCDRLELLGDIPLSASVERCMYEDIAEAMASKLAAAESALLIDRAWAQRLLMGE